MARLVGLKREWGISIAALLYRAKSLQLVGDSAYTNAMRTMSARGWRRNEPGDRELGPPEKPTLLRRALELASEGWDMDKGRFLEALGLPVAQSRRLLLDVASERPRVEI